ncbi:MAG: hypothetical protein M3509_07290, partial [Chloroflexota bacterium]|nr:hypothetical protein [Chloroflexota bacterium]
MTRPAPPPTVGSNAPRIRPLQAAEVSLLRLGRQRRASEATVRQLVAGYPNRSVWAPGTLE